MNIEVRFFSRGGNTKKVAQAIAKAAGVEARDCLTPVTGAVDLLFLGGAVYGFELDEAFKKYIMDLDPDTVKNAALFSTSAVVRSGNDKMAKLLREKGINTLSQDFHCWGEFAFMRRGHPDESDLEQACSFAIAAISAIGETG